MTPFSTLASRSRMSYITPGSEMRAKAAYNALRESVEQDLDRLAQQSA
jgi:hypothetical protein